jgi:hypothetical protein
LSLVVVTNFCNPEIKLLAVVIDHIGSVAVLLDYPLNKPTDSQILLHQLPAQLFSQPVTEAFKMLVACRLL